MKNSKEFIWSQSTTEDLQFLFLIPKMNDCIFILYKWSYHSLNYFGALVLLLGWWTIHPSIVFDEFHIYMFTFDLNVNQKNVVFIIEVNNQYTVYQVQFLFNVIIYENS